MKKYILIQSILTGALKIIPSSELINDEVGIKFNIVGEGDKKTDLEQQKQQMEDIEALTAVPKENEGLAEVFLKISSEELSEKDKIQLQKDLLELQEKQPLFNNLKTIALLLLESSPIEEAAFVAPEIPAQEIPKTEFILVKSNNSTQIIKTSKFDGEGIIIGGSDDKKELIILSGGVPS